MLVWVEGTAFTLEANVLHFQFLSHFFRFQGGQLSRDKSVSSIQTTGDHSKQLVTKAITGRFLVQTSLCNSQQPLTNQLGNTACQRITDQPLHLCDCDISIEIRSKNEVWMCVWELMCLYEWTRKCTCTCKLRVFILHMRAHCKHLCLNGERCVFQPGLQKPKKRQRKRWHTWCVSLSGLPLLHTHTQIHTQSQKILTEAEPRLPLSR